MRAQISQDLDVLASFNDAHLPQIGNDPTTLPLVPPVLGQCPPGYHLLGSACVPDTLLSQTSLFTPAFDWLTENILNPIKASLMKAILIAVGLVFIFIVVRSMLESK